MINAQMNPVNNLFARFALFNIFLRCVVLDDLLFIVIRSFLVKIRPDRPDKTEK